MLDKRYSDLEKELELWKTSLFFTMFTIAIVLNNSGVYETNKIVNFTTNGIWIFLLTWLGRVWWGNRG